MIDTPETCPKCPRCGEDGVPPMPLVHLAKWLCGSREYSHPREFFQSDKCRIRQLETDLAAANEQIERLHKCTDDLTEREVDLHLLLDEAVGLLRKLQFNFDSAACYCEIEKFLARLDAERTKPDADANPKE